MMVVSRVFWGLLFLPFVVQSWTAFLTRSTRKHTALRVFHNNETFTRRHLFSNGIAFLSTTVFPSSSLANGNNKDRSSGYAIQHSEGEWKSQLSSQQFYILRQGGTERPNTSILEQEERTGMYRCAGCSTPLFPSTAKFHSGTGWPSFASTVDRNVQVETVGALQKTLGGADVRCASCGGHLGDVFQDGFLFVGTPAFVTGERYCIDGGALLFEPKDGGDIIRGDVRPPVTEPSWMSPPIISPRESV